jgi:hypothetical protein
MNDPKFYEWLRNRDKQSHVEDRPRLELPLPPPPVRKETENKSDRGVCVIEPY